MWTCLVCLRAGIAKYTVTVVWLVVNAVLFYITYQEYKYGPRYFYLHQMLGVALCVARGSAAVLNLNCGVMLLPMCKTLITCIRGTRIRSVSRTYRMLLDHCKGFHICCAVIVFIASVIHTFAHCINAARFSDHYNTVYVDVNAASKPREDPLRLILFTVPGATGVIMMIVLILIFSSSTYNNRLCNYNLFWYTHRLYIIFYILLLTHAVRGILKVQYNIGRHTPGCYFNNLSMSWPLPENYEDLTYNCEEAPKFQTSSSQSWMWMSGPLAIYLCDILYRCLKRRSSSAHLTCVVHHPADVTEIRMRKQGIAIKPGQYLLLQCPGISTFEWHPFTVTQVPSPFNDEFSLHIKTLGDWSGRLKVYLDEILQEEYRLPLLGTHSVPSLLYVDGPFGSPCEDIYRYRVCVCVAGGIGITPFASILDSFRYNMIPSRLQRLYLIWMCRDTPSFLCFTDLLQDVHRFFWDVNRPDMLEISLYVTKTSNQEQTLSDSLNERYPVLGKRLQYGRPDWDTVLHRIAESHARTSIGVFSCGPKALNHDLSRWCSRVRHNKAKFFFYHESF